MSNTNDGTLDREAVNYDPSGTNTDTSDIEDLLWKLNPEQVDMTVAEVVQALTTKMEQVELEGQIAAAKQARSLFIPGQYYTDPIKYLDKLIAELQAHHSRTLP